MTTEQNYVGRGPNASTSEQAGENATPNHSAADHRQNILTPMDLSVSQAPSPTPNNRQFFLDQIESQRRDLLVQANDLFALGEDENALTVLSRMLESWMLTTYKKIARTTKDEDMDYWDGYVKQMTHVICVVSNLRDIVASIDSWERHLKQEEGQSHE